MESKGFSDHAVSRLTVGCTFLFLESYRLRGVAQLDLFTRDIFNKFGSIAAQSNQECRLADLSPLYHAVEIHGLEKFMNVLKDKRPSDKSGLTSTRIALLIAGSALPADEVTSDPSGKQPDKQKTGGLSLADQKIVRRLEQLGYTVECELSEYPNVGKACDKALVFISSTFKFAGDMNQFCCALNETPTPIIVSAGELFAPMRLIEADSFRVAKTNKLHMFEDDLHSHPMAARLHGTITISAKPVKVNSGKPGDNAIKIACPAPAQTQECDPPAISAQADPSNQASDQATGKDPLAILAYESGRYMCGVNAAARRIGFFLHDETANDLNSQGWVLFDVAVAWATAEKAKPFDRVYRHEWREIRRRQSGIRAQRRPPSGRRRPSPRTRTQTGSAGFLQILCEIQAQRKGKDQTSGRGRLTRRSPRSDEKESHQRNLPGGSAEASRFGGRILRH